MAVKNQTRVDFWVTYVVAGLIAAGVVYLGARESWALWIIVPIAAVIAYFSLRQPRGMLPAAARPVKVSRSSDRTGRQEGWNALGVITVRDSDPFIVIRGELPVEGVAVAVPSGKWQVHTRAELVTKGVTHYRDAEVRIVQDPALIDADWDWTPSWEPIVPADQGSASQVGRVSVDAGILKARAGKRTRDTGGLPLQPGFSDGAFGVNVVRDPEGRVKAVISRFG